MNSFIPKTLLLFSLGLSTTCMGQSFSPAEREQLEMVAYGAAKALPKDNDGVVLYQLLPMLREIVAQAETQPVSAALTAVAATIRSPETAALNIARDVAAHVGLAPTGQHALCMLVTMTNAILAAQELSSPDTTTRILHAAQSRARDIKDVQELSQGETTLIAVGLAAALAVVVYIIYQEFSYYRRYNEVKKLAAVRDEYILLMIKDARAIHKKDKSALST